jgi:hypothetical protein
MDAFRTRAHTEDFCFCIKIYDQIWHAKKFLADVRPLLSALNTVLQLPNNTMLETNNGFSDD